MLSTALILLLVGWLAAEFLSPFLIIIPPPGHRYDIPSFDKGSFQRFELMTVDQLKLSAAFRPSNLSETQLVVIFVHGIGGKKEHFMGMADWLAHQGFASVVFDGRAHGQSGGRYCTFGYKEKQDIKVIVNWIREKLPQAKIGIWGNSLGGAIALQSLAIEPHLTFGIVQSTFADLEQIVFDYRNRILQGFGSRSISDRALKRAGWIAGFNPRSVCPAQVASQLEQPILLIHGEQDKNISVANGEQIYKALPTTNKQFIKVPGADHFDVFAKGGARLHDELIYFLAQQR